MSRNDPNEFGEEKSDPPREDSISDATRTGTDADEKEDQERSRQQRENASENSSSRRSLSSKSLQLKNRVKQLIYMATQPQPNEKMTPNMPGSARTGSPPRPPLYYTNTYGPMPPPGGPVAFFQNPMMDFSYWAPYPERIPPGIPPGLAHLIAADSIMIIQQVNVMELFTNTTETGSYMLLNSEGLCIFFAYETSPFITRCCCGHNRPLQLHLRDVYQNEIIYMNRLCTCNCFCTSCCFLTALEVYSLPLNPIGAIVQKFNVSNVLFEILDADENVMFMITGPPYCRTCRCCVFADYTINALDEYNTEVGLIRKQWGGSFREYLSNAEVYTVSFPRDLDVQIKAVFIGAMFLINYVYYEG